MRFPGRESWIQTRSGVLGQVLNSVHFLLCKRSQGPGLLTGAQELWGNECGPRLARSSAPCAGAGRGRVPPPQLHLPSQEPRPAPTGPGPALVPTGPAFLPSMLRASLCGAAQLVSQGRGVRGQPRGPGRVAQERGKERLGPPGARGGAGAPGAPWALAAAAARGSPDERTIFRPPPSHFRSRRFHFLFRPSACLRLLRDGRLPGALSAGPTSRRQRRPGTKGASLPAPRRVSSLAQPAAACAPRPPALSLSPRAPARSPGRLGPGMWCCPTATRTARRGAGLSRGPS